MGDARDSGLTRIVILHLILLNARECAKRQNHFFSLDYKRRETRTGGKNRSAAQTRE